MVAAAAGERTPVTPSLRRGRGRPGCRGRRRTRCLGAVVAQTRGQSAGDAQVAADEPAQGRVRGPSSIRLGRTDPARRAVDGGIGRDAEVGGLVRGLGAEAGAGRRDDLGAGQVGQVGQPGLGQHVQPLLPGADQSAARIGCSPSALGPHLLAEHQNEQQGDQDGPARPAARSAAASPSRSADCSCEPPHARVLGDERALVGARSALRAGRTRTRSAGRWRTGRGAVGNVQPMPVIGISAQVHAFAVVTWYWPAERLAALPARRGSRSPPGPARPVRVPPGPATSRTAPGCRRARADNRGQHLGEAGPAGERRRSRPRPIPSPTARPGRRAGRSRPELPTRRAGQRVVGAQVLLQGLQERQRRGARHTGLVHERRDDGASVSRSCRRDLMSVAGVSRVRLRLCGFEPANVVAVDRGSHRVGLPPCSGPAGTIIPLAGSMSTAVPVTFLARYRNGIHGAEVNGAGRDPVLLRDRRSRLRSPDRRRPAGRRRTAGTCDRTTSRNRRSGPRWRSEVGRCGPVDVTVNTARGRSAVVRGAGPRSATAG